MMTVILQRAKEKGLTQGALERKAGFWPGKLTSWKKPKAKPTLEDIKRIAKCLDLPADDLIEKDENPEISPEEAEDREYIEDTIKRIGLKETIRRLTLMERERTEPDIPGLGHRHVGSVEVTPPIPESRKRKPG